MKWFKGRYTWAYAKGGVIHPVQWQGHSAPYVVIDEANQLHMGHAAARCSSCDHDLEAENARLRDQLESSDELVKEQDRAFEEMSERLGDELRAAEELIQKYRARIRDIHWTYFRNGFEVCGVCSDEDDALVPWPCPTALAVGVEE